MSLAQSFIFASFWEGQDPPRRRLKLHMSDAEGLSPHAGDELFSVQSQEYGRAGGGRRAPSATALLRGARSAQARAEPAILLPWTARWALQVYREAAEGWRCRAFQTR